MKKLIGIMCFMMLLLTACASGKGKDDASKGYQEMSGEELNSIMENNKKKEKYLVLDVRSDKDYNSGHVKYAMHLSADELEKNINKISTWKDNNVVTICNTKNNSRKAAEILVKNGFTKVFQAPGVKDYKYETITKVNNIQGEDLQKLVDSDPNIYLIDARDQKDYEAGHLKGANHITVDTVKEKMKEIPKDKKIVVYCYSGNKSFQVAETLSKAGYPDVTNSLDGTKEYENFKLVK